jgi:hypothetical protein
VLRVRRGEGRSEERRVRRGEWGGEERRVRRERREWGGGGEKGERDKIRCTFRFGGAALLARLRKAYRAVSS